MLNKIFFQTPMQQQKKKKFQYNSCLFCATGEEEEDPCRLRGGNTCAPLNSFYGNRAGPASADTMCDLCDSLDKYVHHMTSH